MKQKQSLQELIMAVSQENREELLELCWTAAEDHLEWLDRYQLPKRLVCFLPQPIDVEKKGFGQETIDSLLREGLLLADGPRIRLTDAGRRSAQEIVRRHRLTEVLLANVLDVSEASVESTACQVEHILNAEVTEAVCVFLGHPPSCPHLRRIPSGFCCDATFARMEPLIAPLSRLELGEEATIAFIHSRRHPYLQRLASLGLVPGQRLRLRQRRPALVIQVGETELALDREAGEELFIKRRWAGGRNPTREGPSAPSSWKGHLVRLWRGLWRWPLRGLRLRAGQTGSSIIPRKTAGNVLKSERVRQFPPCRQLSEQPHRR